MFVDVVDDQRITDRSVLNLIVESAAASQKNCDSPQICVIANLLKTSLYVLYVLFCE